MLGIPLFGLRFFAHSTFCPFHAPEFAYDGLLGFHGIRGSNWDPVVKHETKPQRGPLCVLVIVILGLPSNSILSRDPDSSNTSGKKHPIG